MRLGRIPHLDRVRVAANEFLEVRRQRLPINLVGASWAAHALCNVKDDAGEAVLVDKDLLVVGDLAQSAHVGKVGGEVALDGTAKEGCALVLVGHSSGGGDGILRGLEYVVA